MPSGQPVAGASASAIDRAARQPREATPFEEGPCLAGQALRPAELLARIQALLRHAEVPPGERPLTCGDLSLAPTTREIRRGDCAFDLSRKEFGLLADLPRVAQQVLPRVAHSGSGLDEDFYAPGSGLGGEAARVRRPRGRPPRRSPHPRRRRAPG